MNLSRLYAVAKSHIFGQKSQQKSVILTSSQKKKLSFIKGQCIEPECDQLMGTSFGLLVKSAVLCFFCFLIIKLSGKLLSTKSKWKKVQLYLFKILLYSMYRSSDRKYRTPPAKNNYMHQFVTLKIS
jgi:hypothetical protein